MLQVTAGPVLGVRSMAFIYVAQTQGGRARKNSRATGPISCPQAGDCMDSCLSAI